MGRKWTIADRLLVVGLLEVIAAEVFAERRDAAQREANRAKAEVERALRIR